MEIVYIATEVQTFKWQKTVLAISFILICIPWLVALFYQLKFSKRISNNPLFQGVKAIRNATSYIASLEASM